MDNNEKLQSPTLGSIFADKIKRWIIHNTITDIFKLCILHALTIFLTVLMVHPEYFIELIQQSVRYNSFVLPKYLIALTVVFNFGTLSKLSKKFRPRTRSINQYSIEGVPVTEVLDHLFEYQSFKHDDVVGEKTKLKMSRKRFDKLAKKLEDLDVLVRGENRARILNTEYSRADIASMLEGKKRARDIEPLLRRVGNTFKTKPSAKEIAVKVSDSLVTHSDSPPESDSLFRIKRIGGGRVQTA